MKDEGGNRLQRDELEALLPELLHVAREAAVEAGGRLREGQQEVFRISKKGPVNLVTEMDLEAEAMIVKRIRRSFPNHEVLAEEKEKSLGDSPFRWVIDPLDGTTNYAHGYRFYCVSIGVEYNGQGVVGVVYDPVTEELFTALRGKGAWLNERPIQVSTEESLTDALLCTGFGYERAEIERNLELFNRVMLKCRSIRRDGAAALDLCYVACGRFDGYWEITLNPWDVAAGKLIVEEAGGRATFLDGRPCTIYDRELLATNGHLHDAMGRLLKDEG